MHPIRDDRGVALITGMLASLVLVSLGIVAFALAAHNARTSAQNTRRTLTIHAAEAGIDRFFRYLDTVAPPSVQCTIPAENLGTSPASSFQVSAQFYADSAGTVLLGCPPASVPRAALITGVGTSAGQRRVMQTFVRLTPSGAGAILPEAIFAESKAEFSGNAQVIGSPDNADVFAKDDIKLNGGGTLQGNVTTLGKLELSGGVEIKKNATSRLQMKLSNGVVWGHGRSGTQDIDSSNGVIKGNAYYCTGSAPGGTVEGSRIQECPNPVQPATKPFPAFPYNPADWTSAGYVVTNYTSCATAKAALLTATAVKRVVRITSTCKLDFSGQDTVTVTDDLAIIHDGELSMSGQSTFNNPLATVTPNLYLVMRFGQTSPCNVDGVTMSGQAIQGNMRTLIHTACRVTFSGQSTTAKGQIVSGEIKFSGQANLTFEPVNVPGGGGGKFQVDIAYIREVVPGTSPGTSLPPVPTPPPATPPPPPPTPTAPPATPTPPPATPTPPPATPTPPPATPTPPPATPTPPPGTPTPLPPP